MTGLWAKTGATLALILLSTTAASSANRPITGLQSKQDIRVAHEIKDDVWEAGVGKTLLYIRGLFDAYDSLSVPTQELHVSAVLHGETAYRVLKDGPYRAIKTS